MGFQTVTTMRPRFLSLAEVARLTGRHPELLRQWCATGRLPCERIGGSWAIAEDQVSLVQAQPARGRRRAAAPDPVAARVVVAAAFVDGTRGRLVHAELVRRFGLRDEEAGLAQLSLDGVEMVLVAGRIPADRFEEVSRLVDGLGGRIVADVGETWFVRALGGASAARGGGQRRTR